ncbi:hypothetical protein [Chloracidobacterium thermophilum]|uniref:hypothetical protein n=1 Tax=Chloracidobacterium thermophilum TaxID=458033 RepID=UPI001BB2D814|nr:hypothetical protein [Chloracidobacterium thermophilum]QUV80469.1 hypothetical protein J8C08_12765 [Chloracidobacterium thermophilum]
MPADVKSPDYGRVSRLLDDYMARFRVDFFTRQPCLNARRPDTFKGYLRISRAVRRRLAGENQSPAHVFKDLECALSKRPAGKPIGRQDFV